MNRITRTGKGKIVPTIFFGLGMVGSDVVLSLHDYFERTANRSILDLVRFWVIDTYFPHHHENDGVLYTNLGDTPIESLLKEFGNRRSEKALTGWYHRSHVSGAQDLRDWGGDRQVAHALFLWHANVGRGSINLRQRIQRAVQELLSQSAQEGEIWAQIFIVTSLGDGIGSGMFIDFGYLLNDILRQKGEELDKRVPVYGMLVTPSYYTLSSLTREKAEANAWAALMELDYFMHRPPDKRRSEAQIYDFTGRAIKTDRPPFTGVYLLDGVDSEGRNVSDPLLLKRFMREAAKILLVEEGAARTKAAFDSRDGESGGETLETYGSQMGSFGVYALTVPVDEIVDIVALDAARDVASDWLAPLRGTSTDDTVGGASSLLSWEEAQRDIREWTKRIVGHIPLRGLGHLHLERDVRNAVSMFIDKWHADVLSQVDDSIVDAFSKRSGAFAVCLAYLENSLTQLRQLESSVHNALKSAQQDVDDKYSRLKECYDSYVHASRSEEERAAHADISDASQSRHSFLGGIFGRGKSGTKSLSERPDRKAQEALRCIVAQDAWIHAVVLTAVLDGLMNELPKLEDDLRSRYEEVTRLKEVCQALINKEIAQKEREIQNHVNLLTQAATHMLVGLQEARKQIREDPIYGQIRGALISSLTEARFPLNVFGSREQQDVWKLLYTTAKNSASELYGYEPMTVEYVINDTGKDVIQHMSRMRGQVGFLWPIRRTVVIDEDTSVQSIFVVGTERGNEPFIRDWLHSVHGSGVVPIPTGDPYSLVLFRAVSGLRPVAFSRSREYENAYVRQMAAFKPIHIWPDFHLGETRTESVDKISLLCKALISGLISKQGQRYVINDAQGNEIARIYGSLWDVAWNMVHDGPLLERLKESVLSKELHAKEGEGNAEERLRDYADDDNMEDRAILSICQRIAAEDTSR